MKDFNSKDMTKRQIAVATYLIDRLALRAGNEKVQFVLVASLLKVHTKIVYPALRFKFKLHWATLTPKLSAKLSCCLVYSE